MIRSARLSNCLPISEFTFNILADIPSIRSKTVPNIIVYPASSRWPPIENRIDNIPQNRLLNVNRFGICLTIFKKCDICNAIIQKMFRNILLVFFSAMLFVCSWPANGFPFLLLIAFVPLLILEEDLSKKRFIFIYSFCVFLIWNLLVTYWILHATIFGMFMAVLINSLLMASAFSLFSLTKRHLGVSRGWWGFVSIWLAFEYLHFNWDLSWPWLALGNGFSNWPSLVQWYEYTGVLGGSLWVLLSNIFAYQAFITRKFYFFFICLITPVFISFFLNPQIESKDDSIKVVLVQPNIDPYSEKFNGLSADQQLDKLLLLAESKIDSTTDYLIGPETALVEPIWENQFEESPSIIRLNQFLSNYPNLKIILGASTYRMLDEATPLTESARYFKSINRYYEAYNTAFQIDTAGFQLYHKSKLVPGVEMIPFASLFKNIKILSINLGGVSGSLGSQEYRSVFPSETAQVAPIICYESIYGEYVLDYVRHGADFLTIITNDGWWKDTPGYRQHLSYASLRAIETRRSIARSANTGVSAFIDSYGNIIKPTSYWTESVIDLDMPINKGFTFYVLYGNYIGRIASFLALILLFYTISAKLMRIKKPA